LDDAAVAALHEQGFEVAVETNGTCAPPAGVDWICVSPKANIALVLKAGNELKFVFPQNGVDPAQFEELDFQVHYLQPMDGPNASRNTQLATQYCLDHPRWRLSLQTHKLLCIP
jgi:7-carboxy-7-deazaguanine synthase